MTRQHFEAIVRTIANIEDPAQRAATCADAVRELRHLNRNFDRYKFETACGVETHG
jgi:hypothetical protein